MNDKLEFRARKRRSDDPKVATRLALEAAAERAGFDALAVAVEGGAILASCGDNQVCRALADKTTELGPDTIQWTDLLEVGDEAFEAMIVCVPADEGTYFVCAAGGESSRIDEETVNVSMAVLRIKPE
jgi:hypothetical protein